MYVCMYVCTIDFYVGGAKFTTKNCFPRYLFFLKK